MTRFKFRVLDHDEIEKIINIRLNFFQGKGEMQTYWLLDADRNAKKAKKEPAKEEPKK